MTLIDIIKSAIRDAGGDGLSNPDMDCGCSIDDLAPCGCPSLDGCVIGIGRADDDGNTLFIRLRKMRAQNDQRRQNPRRMGALPRTTVRRRLRHPGSSAVVFERVSGRVCGGDARNKRNTRVCSAFVLALE